MAITADMVKKLRDQTGAGMMDCKKALTETNGDYEKAVTLLREKGIAVAAKREQNLSSIDAMAQACLVRFRPIMMTTLAAILATLPIALGFGAGAEARRPLGIAVVGGLLFSQFLTLYLTPAFYVSMERLTQRWEDRKKLPE